MYAKLTVSGIKKRLFNTLYHSKEWHELALILAQKLAVDGGREVSLKHVQQVDESKLTVASKLAYHTLYAHLATDLEKAITHLKIARALDRALEKPSQQFDLTKEIAWNFDALGRLDDAVDEWESLIADFNNFDHSEHQPMLAHKFLAYSLDKIGKKTEASGVRTRWVDGRVAMLLSLQQQDHFKPSNPPEGYSDELSNFFERCRHNVFTLYAKEQSVVQELRKRNAQFEAGSESMRVKMADLLASGQRHLSDCEQLPYFFYMRSVSTFLTAVELAAGGRIPEAYGAIRMCLENSFYAFHLSEKPDDAATWLDRPIMQFGELNQEKKAKRTAIASAFSPTKIMTDIFNRSNELGHTCRFYYEMTIDEGAHPNVDVFRKHSSQRIVNSVYIFGVDFLNPSLTVRCCQDILSATQAVLNVFRLAGWIW